MHYELASAEGCLDGGCLLKRPSGMHTNGGCRCIDHRNMTAAQARDIRGTLYYLRKLLADRDAEIEKLKKG